MTIGIVDGEKAPIAPYFIAKRDRGELTCENCGSADVELNATLSSHAVMAYCPHCEYHWVLTVPAGMERVKPKRTGRAGGGSGFRVV